MEHPNYPQYPKPPRFELDLGNTYITIYFDTLTNRDALVVNVESAVKGETRLKHQITMDSFYEFTDLMEEVMKPIWMLFNYEQKLFKERRDENAAKHRKLVEQYKKDKEKYQAWQAQQEANEDEATKEPVADPEEQANADLG